MREQQVPDTTLILGIGNTLLSDEGVGIHVLEYLRLHETARTDLELLDGGTLSFTLADAIGSHQRLVVVDAARVPGPPGTVEVFEGEVMDERLRGGLQSVHEVGLSDLMDIARLTDSLPVRRALVGIQPRSMDWGDRPTPEVAAAVPAAARAVLDVVQRWNAETGREVPAA
jgi:hydrogenase maturation protease